jgi:hypothetical protein
METQRKWDIFISHAFDDQESFVKPLAIALHQLGVKIWYSEFSLEVGDSISRSIDKGLAESQYGLVVISKNFMGKKWPEYELRGLVNREIMEDKVILPIWHGVTKEDVLKFSPPLADKLALNTANHEAQDIAIQILRIIRPDIYNKHPRAQLERIINGTALSELQSEFERMKQELDKAKEELSQFQCPICKSPMIQQNEVPLDPEQRHWGTLEVYECGHEILGGTVQTICPYHPEFPKFEDYELLTQFYPNTDSNKWSCYAQPKTKWAKMLSLGHQFGESEQEVIQKTRKKYEAFARRKNT